jgi:hypothetical protein
LVKSQKARHSHCRRSKKRNEVNGTRASFRETNSVPKPTSVEVKRPFDKYHGWRAQPRDQRTAGHW